MTVRGAFVAFAFAVLVFHNVPAFAGDAGTWIDLVTPFAVIGAAAFGIARASLGVLVVGFVGAVLYVDGHGIHLAANDIGREEPAGDVERVTHFWDETFGHLEWHVGWLLLLGALALADRERRRTSRGAVPLAAATLALGFTIFTNTVEGGDWWLTLAAAPIFAVLALRFRSSVAVAAAAALALASGLIGVWAAWHGGVPQFSEVGLI